MIKLKKYKKEFYQHSNDCYISNKFYYLFL